jgi:hypothetical protein
MTGGWLSVKSNNFNFKRFAEKRVDLLDSPEIHVWNAEEDVTGVEVCSFDISRNSEC